MSQSNSQVVDRPPVLLRPLLNQKSRRITLAVLAGVILLGGGIWYGLDSRSVIDRQLVAEADFTVYAPKQAPVGYTVEGDKTSLSNGVLSYTFADQTDDKDITITVQAKPSGFDMSALSKGGSVNSIATSAGTLYNLSAGGSSQYLLDAGDSLVYITSPSNIDTATASSVANSLNKYD